MIANPRSALTAPHFILHLQSQEEQPRAGLTFPQELGCPGPAQDSSASPSTFLPSQLQIMSMKRATAGMLLALFPTWLPGCPLSTFVIIYQASQNERIQTWTTTLPPPKRAPLESFPTQDDGSSTLPVALVKNIKPSWTSFFLLFSSCPFYKKAGF